MDVPVDDAFEILAAAATLSDEDINEMLLADPARAVGHLNAIVSIIPRKMITARAEQLVRNEDAGKKSRMDDPVDDRADIGAEEAGNPASGSSVPMAPRLAPRQGEPAGTDKPARKGMGAANQKAYSKPRLSKMTAAVTLARVGNSNSARAVSIDNIEAALKKAGIPVARASLVTRLNRMKELGLLAWDKASRGQDITSTKGGIDHLAALRDRYLSEEELAFLKQRVPELFP